MNERNSLQLTGLIGRNIGVSCSPAIHEAAASALNLRLKNHIWRLFSTIHLTSLRFLVGLLTLILLR